jgi:HEAT repeat protein
MKSPSLEAAIRDDEAQLVRLEREKALLGASFDSYKTVSLSLTKFRLSGLKQLRELTLKLAQAENKLAQAQDMEKNKRSQAALKLGELGLPTAIEPLIATLQDEYPEVRNNVIQALGNLHWQPTNISEQLLYLIVQNKLEYAAKLDGPVTETLAEFLADPSYKHFRLEIVKTLAKTGDAGMVRPLIKIIDDKTNLSIVRVAAIEAIGKTGCSENLEARDTLAKELGTPDQIVSAIALGRLGDKRAAKTLLEKLSLNENAIKKELQADNIIFDDLAEATQILLKVSAKDIDSEDLERLAKLQDIRVTETEYYEELDLTADEYRTITNSRDYTILSLDLSSIRELAQRELKERKGKK